MKKTQTRMYQSLGIAAMLLGSTGPAWAQIPDNNLNSFDSSSMLSGGSGGGIWYGTSTVTWDGSQDNTGNGGGSAHIQSTWGSDQANADSPFEIYLGSPSDQLYYIPSPLALSQYVNVQFDFKWDNSSTMTIDEFNNMALVPTNDLVPGTTLVGGALEVDVAMFGDSASIGNTNVPDAATNGWVHLSFPIDSTKSGLDGSAGIMLRPAGYFANYPDLTNDLTANFWIDNLFLKGTAAPPPPPTVTLTKPSPGLNFVEGSISGQFDRQNIIPATTGASYSWVGTATPSHPVTYSFNISQFTAPDLNYHIYFYTSAGAGGASAPDYNQTNVLILNVSPATNNTAASVSLTWKTNSPSSGTTGTAFLTNTPTLTGTWQLTFTSDTGGTLTAPGPLTFPFTIDAGLAAHLANPITPNFGINPSTSSSAILGETVVISKIGITGVDPLSADFATTDNFLLDSALDTNTWTVNALFPASIWFVPTNTAYAVNWTLPDNSFAPIVNSTVTGFSNATSLTQPITSLYPGRRVLIPASSLPAGSTAFFALIKRTFTQLQVLFPGETAAPGTATGKTGTPTPVSAGDLVTVTVNAVDAHWNPVSAPGDSIKFATSDGNAILPNNSSLVSGSTMGTFQLNTVGSQTVTVSDVSNTNILSNISSPVTVQ